MPGEETVDLRHRRETPCKDPPLQGECLSHHFFISQLLGVGVLEIARRDTTGWAGQWLGWGPELVNLMWIPNCQPHQTRLMLQQWRVLEP